jgi:hypothetical protein
MSADDFDRDPALTLQLRALLRPPADPAYWDEMETRIMSRVTSGEPSVVAGTSAVNETARTLFAAPTTPASQRGRWSRVGAAAAVAVVVLSAWTVWTRVSRQDDILAYEAAVEAMSPTTSDPEGRPVSDAPREKTVPELFRY